jgi:hypothetical protein
MNQNDFLSWLMDQAEGEEKEDRALLERVLTLNFSAVHASSLVSLTTLIDEYIFTRCRLSVMPCSTCYLTPNTYGLYETRDEVEEIIRREA